MDTVEHLFGGSELDAVCYARPVSSTSALAFDKIYHEQLARTAALERELERCSLERDAALAQVSSALDTQASRHARLQETISQQAAHIVRLEESVRNLTDELRSVQQRLQQAEGRNEMQAVRILDLERQVLHANAELASSDARSKGATSRLADVAVELANTQRRLEAEKESSQALESKLVNLLSSTQSGGGALTNTSNPTHPSATTTQRPLHLHQQQEMVQEPPKPNNRALKVAAQAPHAPQVTRQPTADSDFQLAEQLEQELLSKCQLRDEAETKLRRLENQKLRTIAEKAKRDALMHEISILSHEISDVRMQLRAMQQLIK